MRIIFLKKEMCTEGRGNVTGALTEFKTLSNLVVRRSGSDYEGKGSNEFLRFFEGKNLIYLVNDNLNGEKKGCSMSKLLEPEIEYLTNSFFFTLMSTHNILSKTKCRANKLS